MSTYAKDHGCGRDWWAAIAKAKEGITWDEHELLVTDARGWVTCACGNQCSSIPRTITGRPHDEELVRLGESFADAIISGDWSSAENILRRIEERAKKLLTLLRTAAD